MRYAIASFLLAAISFCASAADEITFTVHQPAAGQKWREIGTVNAKSTYEVTIGDVKQEGSNASSSEFEMVFHITNVNAGAIRNVTITYTRNRSTVEDMDRPSQLEVSPLEGKTYVVSLPIIGAPIVRRQDGMIPSQAENDLVVDGTAHLAKPTLSAYLAGLGVIHVGDTIELPAHVVRDAWSSDLFVAKEIEMKLDRVIESGGSFVGAFDVDMKLVNAASAPYSLDARVAGTMWIHERGSRIVKTTLSGPIEMRGEWGEDPKIRMKGSGTVASRNEITDP